MQKTGRTRPKADDFTDKTCAALVAGMRWIARPCGVIDPIVECDGDEARRDDLAYTIGDQRQRQSSLPKLTIKGGVCNSLASGDDGLSPGLMIINNGAERTDGSGCIAMVARDAVGVAPKAGKTDAQVIRQALGDMGAVGVARPAVDAQRGIIHMCGRVVRHRARQ